LAHPSVQMRFERGEIGEAAPRNGIMLHIADATFILALGAGPVRCTSSHPEAPMPRKGMQARVDHHLSGSGIMMGDQSPRVIEEDFLGYAAEGAERPLHTFEPMLLPLAREGTYMHAPRVPQGGNEEEDFVGRASNLDPPLAKVDLQLLTRSGLKPDRGLCLRPHGLAQWSNCPLHCRQADRDAFLGRKLLAHHIGIARVPPKSLRQPVLQAIERLRPS